MIAQPPTAASGSPTSMGLETVTSILDAFRKIPEGEAVLRLAKRLGITTDAETVPAQKFRTRYSNLSDDQLSDLMAQVSARGAALADLVGLVGSMQIRMKARAKAVRAAARTAARDNWAEENPEAKKLTATELNDLVEQDPLVLEHETQQSVVEMLYGMLQGTKEGHLLMRDGISREIALRTSKMKNRLGY